MTVPDANSNPGSAEASSPSAWELAITYVCARFSHEVRKKPYVTKCFAGYVERVFPVIELSIVIDIEPQFQTSHLVEIVQLFIKHFGDQPAPTIEFGSDCICISGGTYVPKPTSVMTSSYATSY